MYGKQQQERVAVFKRKNSLRLNGLNDGKLAVFLGMQGGAKERPGSLHTGLMKDGIAVAIDEKGLADKGFPEIVLLQLLDDGNFIVFVAPIVRGLENDVDGNVVHDALHGAILVVQLVHQQLRLVLGASVLGDIQFVHGKEKQKHADQGAGNKGNSHV